MLLQPLTGCRPVSVAAGGDLTACTPRPMLSGTGDIKGSMESVLLVLSKHICNVSTAPWNHTAIWSRGWRAMAGARGGHKGWPECGHEEGLESPGSKSGVTREAERK